MWMHSAHFHPTLKTYHYELQEFIYMELMYLCNVGFPYFPEHIPFYFLSSIAIPIQPSKNQVAMASNELNTPKLGAKNCKLSEQQCKNNKVNTVSLIKAIQPTPPNLTKLDHKCRSVVVVKFLLGLGRNQGAKRNVGLEFFCSDCARNDCGGAK